MENEDILMRYSMGVVGISSIANSFRERIEELEKENELLKHRLVVMVRETIRLEKVIAGGAETSINSLIDELVNMQGIEYKEWCLLKGLKDDDITLDTDYDKEWVCIGDLKEGRWRIDIILKGEDVGRAIMGEKELRKFLKERLNKYGK